MRAVIFVSATVCAWYLVVGQDINDMRNMPKYDTRYDYLDVDAILDSKRLVRNYVQCLINSQRCTPEGKALKRILPEALRTKCVRCTEKQKRTAVKVIKRIKYEYPEEWAKLSTRWDPTGDFTRYFEEFLAKDNFNAIYNNGKDVPSSTLPPPSPPPPASTARSPPPPSPPPPASTARSPPPPSLPPLALTSPAESPQTPVAMTTETRPPIILNRFGDEGELMMPSSSSSVSTPQPTMMLPSSMRPVSTMKPSMQPPMKPSIQPSMQPPMQTRPTPTTWTGAASDTMPTRFPLRPLNIQPPYTTAYTLIDQISYKIMRTTELVTDILRNTVRAVVG